MDFFTILARVAERAAEPESDIQFVPLDSIWEQIVSLSWFQAVLAVSFGVVYLLYGWRIFKVLVAICFGLIGLFIGVKIGSRFDAEIQGGVIGLCLAAAVSVPLMHWAVSALGAVSGGVLTAGVWYAFELPEKYILAGAAIGLVAGGMISFIVFKAAIMLFTSLGGGALIVAGLLNLFYHYESIQDPATENVKEMFFNHNWFLPVLLLAPTIIGVIVQNKFIKGSKDWSV